MTESNTPSTLFFDFGGVLAEEGFREGLMALAQRFDLDPQGVFAAGADAVYDSGYVTGTACEADFWSLLSRRTGLPPYRPGYTAEILQRFVLRRSMIAAVERMRKAGFAVAILSDQTDWLDRLDRRDHFFAVFDRVFNSYHLGIGKRDPAIFPRVTSAMHTVPQAALFIDDNADNVRRAEEEGLTGHLFRDVDSCLDLLHGLLGKAEKTP